MNRNRPPESPELVTVGVMPVQSFVARALEVPPGTPARPRSDRPPFAAVECASSDETKPEGATDAGQPCDG
jgi:hypothetical protein